MPLYYAIREAQISLSSNKKYRESVAEEDYLEKMAETFAFSGNGNLFVEKGRNIAKYDSTLFESIAPVAGFAEDLYEIVETPIKLMTDDEADTLLEVAGATVKEVSEVTPIVREIAPFVEEALEEEDKSELRRGLSKGGIIEGPEVPFTKEDPADRVNPYTGEPYQDQMDRLGFLSGGSTLQSSQNKKYFEEFHNKVLDEGNELVVDGETVTMNIIGVEHKGKEYLIPSYDPATKKILSAKEAKQKYLKDIESGKIKGYNNPEEAEKDRQIFYPQIIRSRDV